MDYISAYRKFIRGYYFGHGLQTAFCIIFPSVAGYYLGQFSAGIMVSVGSLCISSVDTPGSPNKRRNALVTASLFIFLAALSMSSFAVNTYAGYSVMLIFIFLFSMAPVYGVRASNIGLAAIYAMILSTEEKENLSVYVEHSFLLLAGSLWYAFVSLLTYTFRPFQLIQQALSDCIYKTASYLRTRAAFYHEEADYTALYDKVIQQQIEVGDSQTVIRSLLLQRRMITKDSTPRGRSLLLIMTDIINIYEQVMAAHVNMQELKEVFQGTGILESYQSVILALSDELEEIASAVSTGKGSFPITNFKRELELLETQSHALRKNLLNEKTISAFISLRNVRRNISLITDKIARLHRYTRLNENAEISGIQLADFADHEEYSLAKFKSNLGKHSIFFRHAVRVTVAVAAAILISRFLPVQRSYWILFTLIVILKPGFSLTKKRNADRLMGTVAGAIFAILILVLIKPAIALFVILTVCMIITYTFSSLNYALSTFTTTCFVLIFFDLLKPGDFSFVQARIIDTAIGSGLAFMSSYLIFPVWEFQQVDSLLQSVLKANRDYFESVAEAYTGEDYSENTYKLARKEVYVVSGNLGSAFQRMMSEPKSKQQNLEQLHQFVVLCNLLSSHIASLASYSLMYSEKYHLKAFEDLHHASVSQLDRAISVLKTPGIYVSTDQSRSVLAELNTELENLRAVRIKEFQEGKEDTENRVRLSELSLVSDQFRFIYTLSTDILKVCVAISVK